MWTDYYVYSIEKKKNFTKKKGNIDLIKKNYVNYKRIGLE